MRRTFTAILALFSALAFTATVVAPANAAELARVGGQYETTLTITSHKLSPEDVGDSSTAVWSFRPQCTYPQVCDTVVIRPRPSGHPASVRYTIRPELVNGNTVYTGSKTYLSACFFDDGSLVEDAYRTTERMRLVVTDTRADGVATDYRGTLVLVFEPTATGVEAGCEMDRITARFVGERI